MQGSPALAVTCTDSEHNNCCFILLAEQGSSSLQQSRAGQAEYLTPLHALLCISYAYAPTSVVLSRRTVLLWLALMPPEIVCVLPSSATTRMRASSRS